MKLVSIREVADYLKVKESTLYSWAHSGYIPCFKLNGLLRFDLDEIEHWIKEARIKTLNITTCKKKKTSLDIDEIIKRTITDIKKPH